MLRLDAAAVRTNLLAALGALAVSLLFVGAAVAPAQGLAAGLGF